MYEICWSMQERMNKTSVSAMQANRNSFPLTHESISQKNTHETVDQWRKQLNVKKKVKDIILNIC